MDYKNILTWAYRVSYACLKDGLKTDSQAAADLWHFSNHRLVGTKLGADVMRSLGFVPFSGFPLERSNKRMVA